MLFALALSVIAAFAVTQLAIFSTTIYLHRTATHRGLALHPAVAFSFRFPLWLTTGISTKEWVAVHRKHHAFTDEAGDPHSPLLKGFWRVQLGNVFYYIREARNRRGGPEVRAGHQRRFLGSLDLQLRHGGSRGSAPRSCARPSGSGAACSPPAFTRSRYVFVLSSSINGLCHHVGYKNFGNTATNLRVLALITGGEGLHNNHHAFPRSPKFSVRRGEIDPAWPIVKLLTLLTLARPQRTIAAGQPRGHDLAALPDNSCPSGCVSPGGRRVRRRRRGSVGRISTLTTPAPAPTERRPPSQARPPPCELSGKDPADHSGRKTTHVQLRA